MRESRCVLSLLYVRGHQTEIIKDGMAFANGVVLTHEKDALLVIEMLRSVVWRYQLTGPNAGELYNDVMQLSM